MAEKKPPRKRHMFIADSAGVMIPTRARADHDFEKARRRAFIEDFLALFRYEPRDLLPFKLVYETLQLRNKVYLGLKEIPLEQIIGSVGRYTDFTRTFSPRKTDTRSRWVQLESLTNRRGWPPIELYKVSAVYFVKDGNHRVSVARQLEMETIEAEVWEYPSRVPLVADDDLEDLPRRAEYLEFLDDTQLDKLRPEQSIILTIPGGYWRLEEAMAIHRLWLSLEQKRDMPWREAVLDWYDHIYLPFIEKVNEENLLTFYPGRTDADIVVYILQHWAKMERQAGDDEVTAEEVINDFILCLQSNIPRRILAWIERTFFGKPVEQVATP